MSEPNEFEGKTTEKAVQQACDRLGIPRKRLKYEVISEGSSGIFGLVGARKARIRVTTMPVDSSAPVEKAIQAETPSDDQEPSDAPERVSGPADGGPNGDASAELGRELIQRIIDAMTTDTSITVARDDGRLNFSIEGGNPGIMIGKRGQTLEAIHYLVEKIVNKHSEKRIRVNIDVGGYLENRRENLRQLAGRMAKKARQTGKPATIGQMNAHDRRIVHLALKDDARVRTQSIGEGHIRKLVIFPKERRPKAKRHGGGNRQIKGVNPNPR
jgi:spoIIIJ-associated protein